MSLRTVQRSLFRGGSRTYFTSSMFFPPAVQSEVSALYAFVRTADDFVDRVPQDEGGFADFRESFRRSRLGSPSGNGIVDSFVGLARRRAFDPDWIDAFLDAMEADLHRRHYDTVAETLGYVHGSAEVIGFFMARILGLPDESLPYAGLLGRAMQYINFIRDIAEDLTLGRRYLALATTGLPSLAPDHARTFSDRFHSFMAFHLGLYREWQREAEQGFRFIPRRYLIPIKTASDMYAWTAGRIERDPFIVYDRKVKPRRVRILAAALGNALSP